MTGPYEHRGAYNAAAPDEHGHHPKPGAPSPPPPPDPSPAPDPKVVDIAWPATHSTWAGRALTRADQHAGAVRHG